MKKPTDFAVALLTKMKGKGKPEPEADVVEGDEEDAPIAPSAEAAAFKKVRLAITSGGDDAAGAKALKQFLSACGVYDDGEEE